LTRGNPPHANIELKSRISTVPRYQILSMQLTARQAPVGSAKRPHKQEPQKRSRHAKQDANHYMTTTGTPVINSTLCTKPVPATGLTPCHSASVPPLDLNADLCGSSDQSWITSDVLASATTIPLAPGSEAPRHYSDMSCLWFSNPTISEFPYNSDESRHRQNSCGTLPPCTDPDCSDTLPCPVQSDPCDVFDCFRNACFDEQCLSTLPNDDLCCTQPCPPGTRCASPCFSQQCGEPVCDFIHTGMRLPAYPCQSGRNGDACDTATHSEHLAGPPCECVNPDCLSSFYVPAMHDHDLQYFHLQHENNEHSSMREMFFAMPDSRYTYDDETPPNALQERPAAAQTNHVDPWNYIHDRRYSCGAQPQHENLRTASTNDRSDNDFREHIPLTPELSASLRATPASSITQSLPSVALSSDGTTCQWSNDPYNGPPCGQQFDTAEELHRHVEETHIECLPRDGTKANEGYHCHWLGCDRYMCRCFKARPKLKRHMQTHTLWKPFKCAACGARMKTKDAMEKHERIHTGVRPYKCTHGSCNKIFATSTELKTHIVVHSGQKPHKCPICEESFADSSNLSKHKKTHFVGMYKCPDCGFRMKRWDQLRRHLVAYSHALVLLSDMKAQQEYKATMDREFRELPREQKVIGKRKSHAASEDSESLSS